MYHVRLQKPDLSRARRPAVRISQELCPVIFLFQCTVTSRCIVFPRSLARCALPTSFLIQRSLPLSQEGFADPSSRCGTAHSQAAAA